MSPIPSRVRRRHLAALARDFAKLSERAEEAREVSLQEFEEAADRYLRAPSGVLAGILGGVVGGAGGLGAAAAGIGAMIVTGPFGLVGGAALGVLAYRGPKWVKLERSGKMLESSAEVIKRQIEGLPEDTPPEVRNEFWTQYRDIMRKYVWVATESI